MNETVLLEAPTVSAPDPRQSAGPVCPPLTVVARRHDSLDAVAPVWQRMQREGLCTAYQTLEWARILVQEVAAAEAATLLVVEVADGASGRPLMLLPFVRRRRALLRVIEWLDFGVCDYACPIMAEGLALTPVEMRRAWAAIRSVLPRADLLLIDGIPADIFDTANPLTMLPGVTGSEASSFGITIHGDPASLLKRVCSASFVRDVGKYGRRLAREGEVRFVAATGAEEIDQLFAVLLDQRLRRFRAMGRADLLRTQHFVSFYRQAARDGIAGGPARLFGLSVDGEWVATAYGLVHHGAFHGAILAMGDDRWHKASPGMCLMAELLRWSREQGLSYFDLTVGSPAYKIAMGAQSRALFEINQAATLRGHLVLAARRGLKEAEAWLRRHPELFERARHHVRAARRLKERLTGLSGQASQSAAEGPGVP